MFPLCNSSKTVRIHLKLSNKLCSMQAHLGKNLKKMNIPSSSPEVVNNLLKKGFLILILTKKQSKLRKLKRSSDLILSLGRINGDP